MEWIGYTRCCNEIAKGIQDVMVERPAKNGVSFNKKENTMEI